MANSKITLVFNRIPLIDEEFNFLETTLDYSLTETFKSSRITFCEVKIPPVVPGDLGKYEMTIAEGTDIINIGIRYSPNGIATEASLVSLLTVLNPDGSSTYTVCSSLPVVIYDEISGNSIVWPEGEFLLVGSCNTSYDEFISTNYKNAFELDFNQLSDFTVQDVPGESASGLGTVIITANYPGAFFLVETNTAGVTYTIENEEVAPVVKSVSPSSITFDLNTETVDIESKTIHIVTDGDWMIEDSLPDWIDLSGISGNGNSTVVVTPVDFGALSEGQYQHTLLFQLDGDYFEVLLTLNVSKIIKNPFGSGGLYFTEEDLFLEVSSANLDSYIHFLLNITLFEINTNQSSVFLREYKFPLFKGKGSFKVGEIVGGLLDEIGSLTDYVTDFKSNYVKKQLRPAEITVNYIEKKYATDEIVSEGALSMFKMIKGYRPFMSSGNIGLLTVGEQEITRITPKSIIGFSFVYVGKPRIVVKKNNLVIEDFQVDETDNEIIYSYYRFLNDLKPGDSIDLIIVKGVETRSKRYLVFKNGKESTYFFYENSNGMIEPYEFTGRRRVNSAVKHTTTTKIRKSRSFEKKIFSENQQGLIVNTGQLLKSDHHLVLSIIRSPNVWCCFDNPDGPYFLVDATTTKLINQDTEASEEDFDIDFNIIENSDASIYPQ